jgi:hypothetical protein
MTEDLERCVAKSVQHFRYRKYASWLFCGFLLWFIINRQRFHFLILGLCLVYLMVADVFFLSYTRKAGFMFNDWDSNAGWIRIDNPNAWRVHTKLRIKQLVLLGMGLLFLYHFWN